MEASRRLTVAEADTLIGERAVDMEPTPLEYGTVVTDKDTGEPVLGYTRLGDVGPMRRALMRVDCRGGVQRTQNYRSKSRTFGYAPRRPVMGREGCTMTSLNLEMPEVARTLEGYADELGLMLTSSLPGAAEKGRDVLGDVLPEWRMGAEKLWTSGVINDTAQLPYHRDGFNFPVWSSMVVVRRGTRGGYLHIPEYGLVVPCDDGSVVFFEGRRWVHGVTPMTKKADDGYRISVVYYALSGMKNCREAAEETAFATLRRTERERDMARRLAVGDTSIPNQGVGALDRMHGSLAKKGFDHEQVPRR